jgi:hypothetical protein
MLKAARTNPVHPVTPVQFLILGDRAIRQDLEDTSHLQRYSYIVIPAQAGIQSCEPGHWPSAA